MATRLLPLIFCLLLACHPYRTQASVLDNELKRVQVYETQVFDWINKKTLACKTFPEPRVCTLSVIDSGNKAHDLLVTARTDIRKSAQELLETVQGDKVLVVRTSKIEDDLEKLSSFISKELK